MAQSILYYPTIDIPDGPWLRNALLYWDNISSIVPYRDYSDLSPELQYLRKCGIYEPIFPQDIFTSEYTLEFEKAIISRLERHLRRKNSFRENRHSGTVAMHRKKIYAPALCESIHYRKIPLHMFEYLTKNNFISIEDTCGDWIEMDAYAATLYMRTLAEYAVKCNAKDIVIGTDSGKHQADFYTRTSLRENSSCISISLNDCLPQPSMDISYEELLDFKQNHAQELSELRNKLREFETLLSSCSEPEEIKFQTERFKESWQLALSQMEKMFTREQVAFSLGTLTTLISAPSIVESLGNIVQKASHISNSSIVSAALLGGAAAIGVGYQFVNYRNKICEQRSSAGFSYLLKASKAGIIKSI